MSQYEDTNKQVEVKVRWLLNIAERLCVQHSRASDEGAAVP